MGGIAKDQTASRLVSRRIRSLQQRDDRFCKRLLDQRFNELRIGDLVRWQAVQTLGTTVGQSVDRLEAQILADDRESIAADLFYFADEFLENSRLWNLRDVGYFCNGLCFLCGDSVEEWQNWLP
jgi:hypothetical protein